ncbi:phosphoserine phosphatase SerB [Shewanella sp. ULN5]|uniref:phosphoserine phosphatase SerB n=1 Tax=Shewanella sp. ULN5 TaxID=2994678 RepID=UPI00274019D4|nr:phosphoserine phosphatase SerB [Shewanella sp. ULN5]MDP5146122.1 phosphoserine phosphatase SerB [Shewanella sp. ULN5]
MHNLRTASPTASAVNKNGDTILTWLLSSSINEYQHNGLLCQRYNESDYLNQIAPSFSKRVRVVFEQSVQQHIDIWLASLSVTAGFSLLSRSNDLIGIEIATQQPLDELITAFAHTITQKGLAAELLVIGEPLPLLYQKGLLVMDMDSTAIQIECIDELAALAGVGEEVAAVTASAMRGELDFEQSLRLRVSKLASADAAIIDTLCKTLPLMPGLTAALEELQTNQWRVVVASGGFTPFVNHLMHLLKLDAAFANELVIEEGKLTGQVTGAVVDAQYKANVISKCAQKWQIAPGQIVAIGDGANDIPMIQAADLGVAFHAKPKLIAAANLAVSQLDLRALVFCLQG